MEILFRGKRIDHDEWVYGGVYTEGDTAFILGLFSSYPVIPETIGQYTGMEDKNGVKIFEGDVLHWDLHWGWYVGYENGAFRKIPLSNIQRINWRHYPLEQEGLKTWEVIGNIHDNPELLDG